MFFLNFKPLFYVLISSRLLVTEKVGQACRDDSVEGLKFYPNLFVENQITWTNVNFTKLKNS